MSRAALREAAEGALVIRDGEGKQILSDAALKTVVVSAGANDSEKEPEHSKEGGALPADGC